MIRTKSLIILMIGCLLVVGLPSLATTWNAASDFSETVNGGSNPWSYAFWAPGTTLMDTGGTYQGNVNVGGWTQSTISNGAIPCILKTRTSSVYYYLGSVMMPDEVFMHSAGGVWAIVHFTFPTTGTYKWDFTFTGREKTGTIANVMAYSKYGAWAQAINGYGDAATVSLNSVNDFVAGDGFDLYIEGNSTGLKANFTLVTVPEPSSLLTLAGMFGCASFGFGRFIRRK